MYVHRLRAFLPYHLLSLDTVPAGSTCTNSVTLSPSGSCVLVTTLEGLFAGTAGAGNDHDRGWVPIVQGSIPSWASFIDNTSLAPATRVLKVQTNAAVTTFNNPVTYTFRWKTTDALSHMDLGTVYQNFTITINYACYDATLTLNNNADNDSDRTVIDGAAAVTIATAVPSASANDWDGTNAYGTTVCRWRAALFLYDDALEEYVALASHADNALLAIDTNTGIVTAQIDTGNALSGGVI